MTNKIFILIILLFLQTNLSANDKCIVPDILLRTIKITENENSYPYYIRTNQDSTLEKFVKIASDFGYRKTKEKKVIDCLNTNNCIEITKKLIENNITNLDLGLAQINYNNFKYPLSSYFDKDKSYENVCKIIQEKIKINKGKWSWETLASYHSLTPKYNEIYKKKLITNYIKLIKQQNYNSIVKIVSIQEPEDILIMN